MIYIGADHAGFNLKEEIKKYLVELGYDSEDLGNLELDPKDDYPDFAKKVAKKVAQTKEKGILFCGSGLGVCLTANKEKGIRAVSPTNAELAKLSREHNDANVLCLGGRVLDIEEAKKIVSVWLKTEFSQDERHMRRIRKVDNVDKKKEIDIIPTIITQDISGVVDKIKEVEPYVKWVQLDIMDGIFVDNTTWNKPSELKKVKTALNMEAHLMINEPEKFLNEWISSGVKRIILHYESSKDIQQSIDNIVKSGLKAGLAINPETSVETIYPYIDQLDLILIMTVNPGKGGQKFMDNTLSKIKEVRNRYPNLNVEVDGGINIETASKVIEAGANLLASGTAIYMSENIEETIDKMKGN